MGKSFTLRGRVSHILKSRLQRYIESENRRGRSVDESSVVRDAVVEYLDRMEERPEIILGRAELNERANSGSAAGEAAAEASAEETARELEGGGGSNPHKQ